MALFVGDPSAPTRFGTDVADTSDATGLFLKLFGGEVFAAFSEEVHTMDKHFVREISSGKSAQFPKTWKVSAAYHSAGQEMLGQDTDETERVISIDGLLVAHIGIYDLDEAMSHFDIRSRYTQELGRALARVFDTNVYPNGSTILSANAAVGGTLAATAVGAVWHDALRVMRVEAGTANIPAGDPLYLAVPYNTFDSILYSQVGDTATNEFLIPNRDLAFGGQGGPGNTTSLMVGGINIFPTNLLPQSDDTANGDVKTKYRADYSGTLGVGWHQDGVGTTKLIGMGLEQTRDVRRQEDFIVAKVAVGHGPVRNEGTWEIRDT